MKVLSLFDGMACGRIALEQLGIPVEKYYASEVDKYAIQVAQANYPDIIQVGDVCDLSKVVHNARDLVWQESNWHLMILDLLCFLNLYVC
jgi:site-specific DNA-cytosine methylase